MPSTPGFEVVSDNESGNGAGAEEGLGRGLGGPKRGQEGSGGPQGHRAGVTAATGRGELPPEGHRGGAEERGVQGGRAQDQRHAAPGLQCLLNQEDPFE